MVNRGVGGSTAVEWGTGVEDTEACKARPVSCSAASAFAATFGKGYSKAWLSVGGNDYLGKGCNPATKDTIVANVKATIASVLAAATTPGFTILLTGYGAISSSVGEDCKATDTALLNQAVQEAVAASPAGKVTFINVLSTFGGSATSYSSAEWYADSIHLNKAGYDKMFQLPAVQSFFGCKANPVFVATCGETTDGGAVFAACTGSRVYDSTKAATTSPSDATCCKAAAAAAAVTHTGFLIDLYCWDKPNHMAIDRANLGTEPEKHTVHCLRDVQVCIDGGYALLEKKAGATSYSLKYKLDATGNANILKLIKTTKSIANFQVTATGTASADGLTLNGATFVEGGGGTLGFPKTLIEGAAGLSLDRVLEANGKGV